MSVKIYTAYRLRKASDFWPFMRDARRRGVHNVRQVLQAAWADLYNSDADSPGNTTTKLRDLYKEAVMGPYKHLYDFDTSIAAREHKGRLYLIPHVGIGARGVLDFLQKDNRLEDYSYWNNTDRPDEISYAAWKRRGKVWQAIDDGPPRQWGNLCDDGWSDYVEIVICDYQSYWKVSAGLFNKPPTRQGEAVHEG